VCRVWCGVSGGITRADRKSQDEKKAKSEKKINSN
jgi:hypothetical protein